jgi:predicted nucleic acid-binding protein
VEKNIYCRVKKRSLIRTLVIKKNDEKKGKIKRIFRAHCPKCFKKEMAWQSHKDKRKRKREKEQLVARTTLMITEKAFVCGLDSKCVQLILLVFIFDFLKK